MFSTMLHYCEKLMGVVVFAKGQGQVKFEKIKPVGQDASVWYR